MEQEDTAVQEQKNPENSAEQQLKILALPTLASYQKSYASSLGNNDRKAVMLFAEYEPNEKRIRIRRELAQIFQGKVDDEVCARAVGQDRKGRYGSFAKWAQMMLSLFQSAR